MNVKNIKYIFCSIGFILFGYILFNINLDLAIQLLANISIPLLFFAFFLNLISALIKALKWKYVVNAVSPTFSYSDAVASYFAGFAASIITPAKVGEVIKIFYVDKSGKEYGKAISVVIADRLIDILILFVMAILGICLFQSNFSIIILPYWIVVSLIVSTLIISYFAFNKLLIYRVIQPITSRFSENMLFKIVIPLIENYFDGVDLIRKNSKKIAIAVIYGFVVFGIAPIYSCILAYSIGIEVPFEFYVALIPITCIIDLLPVSISGIGTRDIAYIYLFSFISVNAESALTFSILYMLICYLLMGLIGAFFWIKCPYNVDNNRINN